MYDRGFIYTDMCYLCNIESLRNEINHNILLLFFIFIL